MTNFLEELKNHDHFLYLEEIKDNLKPTDEQEQEFKDALIWALETIEAQGITISKIDQACNYPNTITARSIINKTISKKHLRLVKG